MKTEIETYLNFISNDYKKRFCVPKYFDHMQIMNKSFEDSLSYQDGKVYIKIIIKDSSAHSFIVKEDTKQFKKGDILKAASWKAPAKNFARGNVFNVDSYKNVQWCGA
jgi:hypothetical protein